jgi:hypothetical protein
MEKLDLDSSVKMQAVALAGIIKGNSNPAKAATCF